MKLILMRLEMLGYGGQRSSVVQESVRRKATPVQKAESSITDDQAGLRRGHVVHAPSEVQRDEVDISRVDRKISTHRPGPSEWEAVCAKNLDIDLRQGGCRSKAGKQRKNRAENQDMDTAEPWTRSTQWTGR